MQEIFRRELYVRWADVDFNEHMRNTAYLDAAADVRMMFFESHGFSMREFERLQVGPVVLRDEIEYYRELLMLEKYEVTLVATGFSETVSRMRFRNDIYRADGKLAARVTSFAGWLDLRERRLTEPPAALAELIKNMARSEDFALIETKSHEK